MLPAEPSFHSLCAFCRRCCQWNPAFVGSVLSARLEQARFLALRGLRSEKRAASESSRPSDDVAVTEPSVAASAPWLGVDNGTTCSAVLLGSDMVSLA